MCNPQNRIIAKNVAVQKGHKDIIKVLKTDQSKVKSCAIGDCSNGSNELPNIYMACCMHTCSATKCESIC